MLFNMGVGITAEYTALGDMFAIVLGSTRIPIVIIVGVVTSIYTAFGGLYISIVTDQWQARVCQACSSAVMMADLMWHLVALAAGSKPRTGLQLAPSLGADCSLRRGWPRCCSS